MPRGIRGRLTLTFLAIIAVMALGLGLGLPEVARSHHIASVQGLLLGEARLAADYYATAGLRDADVDAWVKRLHYTDDATPIRLTIIATDGRVLGDSNEQPARMDNHASRPEVRQALAEGYGSSIRYSTTLRYETLYVAIPIAGSDGVVGVARAALPLTEIDAVVAEMRRSALVAAVVAAAIATLIALYIANALAQPLRELTEMADIIAAGRFDRRAAARGSAETVRLAEALNAMAQELRRSFGAIESQRDHLSAIMANMADGIIVIASDGRITTVNAAAARMLHADPKQAEGKHLSAVLRDHELIELAQRAGRATEATAVVERVAPRRYLRGVTSRIGDGPQAPTLLVLQDLTELRRLETVRRDFVANTSHELRTPLAAIKAMVETLESGAIDDAEAARDFVARVHREVDSLSQLVEELLELSRIESGQADLRLAPLAPADLISTVIERLAPLAERAGVTLVAAPAADLPPILADSERIGQALTNLIQNAIKFTPPPGRVTVSARRHDDGVAIAVADTGVGIESDDLPRLFERFYKADRARSSRGTGLGLAVVKHLVLAHGGQVWAESAGPDRGSTFTFTLPLAR